MDTQLVIKSCLPKAPFDSITTSKDLYPCSLWCLLQYIKHWIHGSIYLALNTWFKFQYYHSVYYICSPTKKFQHCSSVFYKLSDNEVSPLFFRVVYTLFSNETQIYKPPSNLFLAVPSTAALQLFHLQATKCNKSQDT